MPVLNKKTPGVYVDEVSKFPPSIAPVETAIPAFIGYTEKAEKQSEDLYNVPTKIGSIAEYIEYFGEGAPPEVTRVTLDDYNNFQSAELNNVYYMYDSLRQFYANGGGDCYIVSIGTYRDLVNTPAQLTEIQNGIKALEKVDEPTILVFPDNSLLTNGTDFYTVYNDALAQCGSLMDRVGLFHVKEDDPHGSDFRSGIGLSDLKYGAVYSPWLKVNYPKAVTYRDFQNVIHIGTTSCRLATLATDVNIKDLITEYEQVIEDVQKINNNTVALASPESTLREHFTALVIAYQEDKTHGNFATILNSLFEVARKVDILVGTTAGAVVNASIITSLTNLISSTLKNDFFSLIRYDKELEANVTGYVKQYDTSPPTAGVWSTIFVADSPDNLDDPDVPHASNVLEGSTFAHDWEKMDQFLTLLRPLFDDINKAWLGSVAGLAETKEKGKHDSLRSNFPLYKTILTGIQNASTSMPPSGAVAGRYAYVDRTRGVWKAPANVSLNEVSGPTEKFTATELDALNINVDSGKSVNAIRFFTGKGTLIFGARTLAGNDNEWRYINVRRFFNFVEESCKKATEQFVFEPNDANTWIKVQAMIENFLTVLWRQGALQGTKPAEAFYCAVGLGKTMTYQDILNGYMIIEIGMAAVRPAEFIILQFSHKMVEA